MSVEKCPFKPSAQNSSTIRGDGKLCIQPVSRQWKSAQPQPAEAALTLTADTG